MTGSFSNRGYSFKKIDGGVEFIASAPGKVILHGEHSAVYGGLAAAATINLRTKIHVVEIDRSDALIINFLPLDFEWSFSLSDVQRLLLDKLPPIVSNKSSEYNWESPKLIDYTAHLDTVEKFVTDNLCQDKAHPPDAKSVKSAICFFYIFSSIVSSVSHLQIKPLCFIVDSQLTMGAGTGSSASYSVALSAAIVHYLRLKTNGLENVSKAGLKPFNWTDAAPSFTDRQLDIISDWAFVGETIFHGTPSGLDNSVCTFGNLVKFRKGHPVTQAVIERPLGMLLVNSLVPRETKKMVQSLAERKTQLPQVIDLILKAIEQVTETGIDLVLKIGNSTETGNDTEKDFDQWQTLFQINHSLLAALGVSHPKLEEINMILDRHRLKGKLTGGGGGGYVIAALSPTYDPEEVIRKLKERGFEVIVTKLGGKGVQID